MTDAERQVAGKTYRWKCDTGIVRSFDAGGQLIQPPGGNVTWTAALMLVALRGGYAEDATAEPEVKVGDRFEVLAGNVAESGYCAGDFVDVTRLTEKHMYVRRARDGHEWGLFFARVSDGTLRRLPPEPAKPLCECGAKATSLEFTAGGCNCTIKQCRTCFLVPWSAQEASHRALKHPEPKDGHGHMMEEYQRHCEERIARELRCNAAVPPPHARKPECACLEPSCMPCQLKLSGDALMFGRMKARDDERRRLALEEAAKRRQPLPPPLQWSPAAMVGGMWAGRGRR